MARSLPRRPLLQDHCDKDKSCDIVVLDFMPIDSVKPSDKGSVFFYFYLKVSPRCNRLASVLCFSNSAHFAACVVACHQSKKLSSFWRI